MLVDSLTAAAPSSRTASTCPTSPISTTTKRRRPSCAPPSGWAVSMRSALARCQSRFTAVTATSSTNLLSGSGETASCAVKVSGAAVGCCRLLWLASWLAYYMYHIIQASHQSMQPALFAVQRATPFLPVPGTDLPYRAMIDPPTTSEPDTVTTAAPLPVTQVSWDELSTEQQAAIVTQESTYPHDDLVRSQSCTRYGQVSA